MILILFEGWESRGFALNVTQPLILFELKIKLKVLDSLSFIFAFLRNRFYILPELDEIVL